VTENQLPTQHYQPFYCEENVWNLIQHGQVPESSTVIVITNEWTQVVMAGQSAGDEDGLVIWDYHVVLLVDRDTPLIWDWDSVGPTPIPATEWFLKTFAGFCAHTPSGLTYRPELTAYAPTFRLIPAKKFRDEFASDRRHMRGGEGQWKAPPPPWPCIGEGHNLQDILDLSNAHWGPVDDIDSLYHRMGFP